MSSTKEKKHEDYIVMAENKICDICCKTFVSKSADCEDVITCSSCNESCK